MLPVNLKKKLNSLIEEEKVKKKNRGNYRMTFLLSNDVYDVLSLNFLVRMLQKVLIKWWTMKVI